MPARTAFDARVARMGPGAAVESLGGPSGQCRAPRMLAAGVQPQKKGSPVLRLTSVRIHPPLVRLPPTLPPTASLV